MDCAIVINVYIYLPAGVNKELIHFHCLLIKDNLNFNTFLSQIDIICVCVVEIKIICGLNVYKIYPRFLTRQHNAMLNMSLCLKGGTCSRYNENDTRQTDTYYYKY